ncbi:MAG: trypsin-like peptidase domain-containing protein [Lentisphaerae bacterium]|nr:trypsin-like peptidase domain-containing protein [Lentisphaerota bacterium]
MVKIYATIQREDYALPWQGGRPLDATGSGFIIRGKRILTNAHIVSDARFLQVQTHGDPRRYTAGVTFIAHDCDLALLTVEDPAFFEGARAVRFADALPALNDEVTVLGFPLGGDRLSITKGVVSRIDYGVYSHSGIDQHLVLQVDAAINPGNSGGPVFYGKRVVGLAFQGLRLADNIGYAIPVPVIRHFLDDVADGVYDGYPELGVAFIELRNAALRRDLALPSGRSGVAVFYVDPFGSAAGLLHDADVLTAIDGRPIADDGTIRLDDATVLFNELLERKQHGESVTFDVWRDGAAQSLSVPLTNPEDPFMFRTEYGRPPRYVMYGGLVFCPLTRNYLQAADRDFDNPNFQNLHYLMQYAKRDGLYRGREAFVIMTRILAHPVNTYADDFLYGCLESVDGRAVGSLQELAAALDASDADFHVLRFSGIDETLVIDAAAAREAHAAIMAAYGLPAARRLGGEEGE